MTLKNKTLLTFFALAMSALLLMSFGPKPKLKGIWYCCSESGYLEMHFSKYEFGYVKPGYKDYNKSGYFMDSDSLMLIDNYLNFHSLKFDTAFVRFKGKDTMQLFDAKHEGNWTFYRIKAKPGKLKKLKDLDKLGRDAAQRSKQYNCPEPKPDSFIYFQF